MAYTTVDDIFKALSVHEIKSLEVQYRAQAAARRSELHQLVGHSYRDLLTTADTIVHMRDTTVDLRRQLTALVDACDSSIVAKNVNNLKAFPDSHHLERRKVMLLYLTDLRGLVIHYIHRGELITATRLYTLGRLIHTPALKAGTELEKRLLQTRRILVKAINTCTDIHSYACSHAILESASPETCLEHYLALQIPRFAATARLKEFGQSILSSIDSTREFANLNDAFQQISQRPLVSFLRDVPEIDGPLLTNCISEDIKTLKPDVKISELTVSSINGQVLSWIDANANELTTITTSLLCQQSNIKSILQQQKELRNVLDESSQLHIYETLLPSIQSRISTLQDEMVQHLVALHNRIPELLKASPPIPIWDVKFPWSKGSLHQFTSLVARVIRHDSIESSLFDGEYARHINLINSTIPISPPSFKSTIVDEFQRVVDGLVQQEGVMTLRLLKYVSSHCPTKLDYDTTHIITRLFPLSGKPESSPMDVNLNEWLFEYACRASCIDVLGVPERRVLMNNIGSIDAEKRVLLGTVQCD